MKVHRFRWSVLAQEDAAEALRWYIERSAHTAERFLLETDLAAQRLAIFPRSGARFDAIHRWIPVSGFPYALIYRPFKGEWVIAGCANFSQERGPWLDRPLI